MCACTSRAFASAATGSPLLPLVASHHSHPRQARQLLVSFPLDMKLKDALFWASPKRPPAPLTFNAADSTHFAFVMAAAQLFAHVHGIHVNGTVLI